MVRTAWCGLLACATVCALACMCSSAWAQGGSFTDRPVPGMRQADRHNPFSPGYVDMTPGGYARRQAFRHGGGFSSFGAHRHFYAPGYSDFYFGVGPGAYGGGTTNLSATVTATACRPCLCRRRPCLVWVRCST